MKLSLVKSDSRPYQEILGVFQLPSYQQILRVHKLRADQLSPASTSPDSIKLQFHRLQLILLNVDLCLLLPIQIEYPNPLQLRCHHSQSSIHTHSCCQPRQFPSVGYHSLACEAVTVEGNPAIEIEQDYHIELGTVIQQCYSLLVIDCSQQLSLTGTPDSNSTVRCITDDLVLFPFEQPFQRPCMSLESIDHHRVISTPQLDCEIISSTSGCQNHSQFFQYQHQSVTVFLENPELLDYLKCILSEFPQTNI